MFCNCVLAALCELRESIRSNQNIFRVQMELTLRIGTFNRFLFFSSCILAHDSFAFAVFLRSSRKCEKRKIRKIKILRIRVVFSAIESSCYNSTAAFRSNSPIKRWVIDASLAGTRGCEFSLESYDCGSVGCGVNLIFCVCYQLTESPKALKHFVMPSTCSVIFSHAMTHVHALRS